MAGVIKLSWRDRNANEQGHRVYKSQTPMDVNSLPAHEVELGADVTTWNDVNVTEGEEYRYIVSAFRDGVEKFSGEHVTTAIEFPPPAPGSDVFVGGDPTDGFFGEVPTTELITGDDLANEIGLSAGTSQHSNEPWLKFAIDEEILYVAKKPYRNDVSWDDIDAVNAVYDDASAPVVTIDGFQFRVTLMTGAEADPTQWTTSSTADDNFGQGSEWNRLMYRVHQDVPTGGTDTYHGGAQEGANWAEYTDADIVVGSGNGRRTWCQETPSYDTSRRVSRGAYGLSRFDAYGSARSGGDYGWRPALRLLK